MGGWSAPLAALLTPAEPGSALGHAAYTHTQRRSGLHRRPTTPHYAAPGSTDEAARDPRAALPGEQVLRRISGVLRRIERDHPDWARLESLGTTRGGREVPLLTLSDFSSGSPVDRPALLLLEESGSSAAGSEALTRFARSLLEQAEGDPAVLGLLQRVAILIAPVPDPDALAEPGLPEVRFSRNFPLGWQPETLSEGAGYRPLSLQGSRALARLLQRERRLALVIGVSPDLRPGRPYAASELPEPDRLLYDALSVRLRAPEIGLLPWSRLASPGGSFLDTAYQACGVPGFGLALRSPDPRPFPERALAVVRELVGRLPRIELTLEEPRRLGSGDWQVDVELHNPQVMPTLSALGLARHVPAEAWLSLEGALLVASSTRRSGESGVFDETRFPEPSDELRLPLGVLQGGETVRVRLIVSGETGSTLELHARAPRAGRVAGRVVLVEEGPGG